MQVDNRMSIKDFCEQSGVVLAENSGEKFTGEILFRVNMRTGGISSVHVTRTGIMVARPSNESEDGH